MEQSFDELRAEAEVISVGPELGSMSMHKLAIAHGNAELIGDREAATQIGEVLRNKLLNPDIDPATKDELTNLVPAIINSYMRIQSGDQTIHTSFEVNPPAPIAENPQPETPVDHEARIAKVDWLGLLFGPGKLGAYTTRNGDKSVLVITRTIKPGTSSQPDDTIGRASSSQPRALSDIALRPEDRMRSWPR